MAEVLVVTSGKGGVGKTTSTAALGAALAQTGQNVVVVDFDVGLRNLDLVMGAERRVVYDLIKAAKGERMEKLLLLTRYDKVRAGRGDMLSIDDVLEILSIPLLGIIPESEEVLRASNLGAPITICGQQSVPARAYTDAARRLMGEEVDMMIPTEKRGLFNKLFGRRAA